MKIFLGAPRRNLAQDNQNKVACLFLALELLKIAHNSSIMSILGVSCVE
jgi:hypothetical protein